MALHQLTNDLYDILHRLVEIEEFADDIEQLGLNPYFVAREVARDPDVRARARAKYRPVLDLQQQLLDHLSIQPQLWPDEWRPSTSEKRLLIGAGSTIVAWLLFNRMIYDLLWAPLSFALSGLLFVTWVVVLLYGLPESVRDRLQWSIAHMKLAIGLPTRHWETKRELRDEVLVPELRGWLDGQVRPKFSTTLKLRDSSGLMMPPGQGPLVPTAAVDACKREINRGMPAAVGIAGSRGAGKTTIIYRAVHNEITEIDREPVLGILTTAPVRYDARDFILHIHASVCRAVLTELSPDRFGDTESQRLWASRFRYYRLRSAVLTWLTAFLWVSLFAIVAVAIARIAWGQHGERPEEVLRSATSVGKELVTRPTEVLTTKPLEALAVALTGLAVVIAAGITLRRLVAPFFDVLYVTATALAHRFADRPTPAEAALKSVARQHLRRIRFLQTRTSGWSGKVAGLGGLELAPARSTANAEQPLTYPEVVERLRDFLELVGNVLVAGTRRLSALVIAIDELDKISDPDEAHRFLNDIKGIFGVRHCVYLVSVSEDALTAFERRGMPTRDAFDSAFTSMARVHPFTLADSQRWLAYRALGIPSPFVWLCHCLSGGLPRDLARVAITMHDLSETHDSLSEFARSMVSAEVQVKIQVYIHAVGQLADRDDSDTQSLLQQLFTLITDTNANKPQPNFWNPPATDTNMPSSSLRGEIQCYFTFCDTLLSVFTDDISETLGSPRTTYGGRSSIERLAEIRRRMSVNTTLAMTALTEFRAQHGITSS